MPRPNIPPQVLAARGVPVRLIDDQEVAICYTFHSLLVLEEKHGGLQKAMTVLASPDAAQFGTIVGLMAAGLEHAKVTITNGDGIGLVVTLDDPEVLSYLLDPMEIESYAEAMGEAFKRSFPQPKAGDQADPPVGETTSPGPNGSTSAQPTSAGPTPSSGQ